MLNLNANTALVKGNISPQLQGKFGNLRIEKNIKVSYGIKGLRAKILTVSQLIEDIRVKASDVSVEVVCMKGVKRAEVQGTALIEGNLYDGKVGTLKATMTGKPLMTPEELSALNRKLYDKSIELHRDRKFF